MRSPPASSPWSSVPRAAPAPRMGACSSRPPRLPWPPDGPTARWRIWKPRRAGSEIAASIYEMLGRASRALGDHDRALAEHRRAASIVPGEVSYLRAWVLASLAQTLMLLGHFVEATRVGGEAIALARDCAASAGDAARSIEAHAMCTVGVARAWGAAGADGITQLESALSLAR